MESPIWEFLVIFGTTILTGLAANFITDWLENKEATHILKIKIKRRGTDEKETLEIDENASASEMKEQIQEQIRTIRDNRPSSGGTPANP